MEAEATKTQDRRTIGSDLRRRVAALVREEELDNVLVGQIVFEPDLPLVGLKARLVCNKLSNLGTIPYLDPPLADIETREKIDVLCFAVVTERPPEQVQGLLRVAGIQEMLIEPLERRRSRARRPCRAAAPPPSPAPSRPRRCGWISNAWIT